MDVTLRVVPWELQYGTTRFHRSPWITTRRAGDFTCCSETAFSERIRPVGKRASNRPNSSLRMLHPVLHSGILRVSGRLSRVEGHFEKLHPAILPYKSKVTDPIIDYEHRSLGHFGRDMVRGTSYVIGIGLSNVTMPSADSYPLVFRVDESKHLRWLN